MIFWNNPPATKLFPGIGFQITNETTHLTIYHAKKQTDLIQYREEYGAVWRERNCVTLGEIGKVLFGYSGKPEINCAS